MDSVSKSKRKEVNLMGLSLGNIAEEVYLRVDSAEGIPKLRKSGVYEILKAAFDVISQAMASGESVSVSYFGKFTPRLQAARKARNPKTGEVISVPEKVIPKFRPSIALRTSTLSAIKAVKKADKKEEKKPVKKKKKK